MLKRLFCLLFTAIALAACFGCGSGAVKIEMHEWNLLVAHSIDTRTAEQTTLARNQTWNAEGDVPVVRVALAAKDGKITLTDRTANKTYSGTYKKADVTAIGSVVYEITLENLSGNGTVSVTKYDDGRKVPTFPLALYDGSLQYSLYFQ